MHWLSIVGILLIAAGTFCTYWGTELRNHGVKTSGEVDSSLQQQLDELHTEQESLLKQAKMIGEENDRLRADNATLTLKHKRAEEDAEVYKYRAAELQKTMKELREEDQNADEDIEQNGRQEVQQIAEQPEDSASGWGEAPPTGMRPPTRGYDEKVEPEQEPKQVLDTVSEMEIIEQLRMHMEARNYEELEQVAAEQVAANPEWMTPYVYLGVAERHLGKRQKALSHFVYVVENGAGDPAYPQAERALKLMTSGIQELAEKNEWGQLASASEKQIKQDPDWYLPYYFGGLAYAHLGQKEKAVEFLEEFVAQGEGDPEYGKALRAMRLLKTNILDLQRKGDYPALIRACEHEIENDPDWVTPHYLLGLSYARLGNTGKAKEHLEIFVNRAPDDPDYSNARRLLDSIR